MIDQELRSACGIDDGGRSDVDPEVVIEGGDDFLHMDRSFLGIFTEAVGRADGLAGSHTAAGEIGAADLSPVIATCTIVDFRCAAELAPDDDGDIIEHPSNAEVIDQGAEALIEFRTVVAHQVKVLAVRIPSAVAEAHHAHASFDQTASDQQMIVAGWGTVVLIFVGFAIAVAFDDLRVFLAQVEGIEQFAAGQHVEGPLFEGIHTRHDATGIDIASHGIEAGQQSTSISQSIEADIVQFHVLHTRSVGFEGRIGCAEETCIAGVGPGNVRSAGGESDEGWYGGVDRPMQFRDSRADRGSAAERFQVVREPTAHALVRFVTILASDDRSDDDRFIHPLGQLRKDFADLDAWDVGCDGAELTADFGGRIGFDFPHILMGRTTAQEYVDETFVRVPLPGRIFRTKEIGEGEATHPEAERANRQEAAARQAAAQSIRTTQ